MKTDYGSFQLVETDLKSPNKIGYICTYQKFTTDYHYTFFKLNYFVHLKLIGYINEYKRIYRNIYETMRVDEGYLLREFTGQMGNLIGHSDLRLNLEMTNVLMTVQQMKIDDTCEAKFTPLTAVNYNLVFCFLKLDF
ncbi:hypothetical protein T05_2620 [Trichinella murrelli]|uniref:Uncharacterized protein n=1 Tax=Trichinella murrelli TaxID=144512 RepID=A0A0V0TJG1_9BILA|nr:hypothetical protein T05_2620 [Trichinella murrelli]